MDFLQESECSVADLAAVLDPFIDGVAEVEADEYARFSVLVRCLRETVEGSHDRGSVDACAACVEGHAARIECNVVRTEEAAAMRPHFTRQVTTSPADYRRGFAAR